MIIRSFKIQKAKIILFVFSLVLVFFIYKNYTGGIARFVTVMSTGVEPIYKIDTKSKEVYLTFNVKDVQPQYVESIINYLDTEKVRAVFFINGQWVEKHGQTVNQILKNHDLGNMGYSLNPMNKKTEEFIIDEIKKTEKVCRKEFNLDLRMFRPPFGRYDRRLVEAADLLGYKIILANINVDEEKSKSSEMVIKYILKNLDKGSIISLNCNSILIEILPKIIKGIKNKGYKFASLSEKIGS